MITTASARGSLARVRRAIALCAALGAAAAASACACAATPARGVESPPPESASTEAPRIDPAAAPIRFEPLLAIDGEQILGSAPLGRPLGLSLDHRKRLFVADSENDRVVILDPEGRFEAEFGRFGSETGQFLGPSDVTAREGFFSYVVDSQNERVQKFDRFRVFAGVVFERGGGDGAYGTPRGVEIDDEGRLYVADVEQHTVWIIDSFRGELLLQIGGFGTEAGRFDEPADVAIGREREIFVADAGNARVQVFGRLGGFLREFDGAGPGWEALPGADDETDNIPTRRAERGARFRRPTAIACDRRGLVYVADPEAGRVAVTDPRGAPLGELRAPGLAAPSGLAFDGVDILFVSDAESGAVRSFRVIVDEALGD